MFELQYLHSLFFRWYLFTLPVAMDLAGCAAILHGLAIMNVGSFKAACFFLYSFADRAHKRGVVLHRRLKFLSYLPCTVVA